MLVTPLTSCHVACACHPGSTMLFQQLSASHPPARIFVPPRAARLSVSMPPCRVCASLLLCLSQLPAFQSRDFVTEGSSGSSWRKTGSGWRRSRSRCCAPQANSRSRPCPTSSGPTQFSGALLLQRTAHRSRLCPGSLKHAWLLNRPTLQVAVPMLRGALHLGTGCQAGNMLF